MNSTPVGFAPGVTKGQGCSSGPPPATQSANFYGVKQVNVHDAKTNLSRLIEDVEAGEEVVIARAGKPVARLTAIREATGIKIGALKGKFTVKDDFDEPLSKEILASIGVDPE